MVEGADIKRSVSRGLAWIGLASSLVGVLDVAATIILLRFYISPSENGLAGVVVPFFPILDLVTDMGLSSAVVQRDDHTPEKLSTVFWINFGISLLLFLGLLVLAPLWGAMLGAPILGLMFIAYGSKLIFQNIYFIPGALLRKQMRFKEMQILRIIANVVEFGAKVGSAASGLGIWAFVIGPLARVFVTGIGIQILHPWRPLWVLRVHEAWDYTRFGLKVSASEILFYFYSNVDYLVVYSFFGREANGFYKAARELTLEPLRFMKEPMAHIALSAFARLRNTREALIRQFVALTRLNMVVMLVFVMLVFLEADDIITLIFGAEWAPAAPAARILCLVGVLRAMGVVVPPLLDGMGRPGATLRYMTVASIVLPAMYIACAALLGPRFPEDQGYVSVAIAWVVGYPFAFIVLVYLALTLVRMSPGAYARAVGGIFGCAGAGLAVGLVVRWLTTGLPGVVRIVIICSAALLAFGLLLTFWQNVGPRKKSSPSSAAAPPRVDVDEPPAPS